MLHQRQGASLPQRPDLSRLVREEQKQALGFAYGVDGRDTIISTTLARAAPLLIVDGKEAEQDHFSVALLSQLYTKAVRNSLKVVFLEQHPMVSLPFASDARSDVRELRAQQLAEEIEPFVERLEQRTRTREALPPWLIVVEAEVLRKDHDGWQEMQPLLKFGGEHGLFVFITASGYEPFLQEYLPVCRSVATRLTVSLHTIVPWLMLYQEEGMIRTIPFFAPYVDRASLPFLLSDLDEQSAKAIKDV